MCHFSDCSQFQCDLPLLVMNTSDLTLDQQTVLKELVLSTCELINASNHVIVAVNIFDDTPLDQQASGTLSTNLILANE